MTLDELKQLDLRDLDMHALMACCGWRWQRSKVCGLCMFQPPVPAEWDAPGIWQPSAWGPTGSEEVRGVPPKSERFSDWQKSGGALHGVDGRSRFGMPRPSSSIADAWELEEAIAAMDLSVRVRYANTLTTMVLFDNNTNENESARFAVVHASPLDRTLAAVLAMEGR